MGSQSHLYTRVNPMAWIEQESDLQMGPHTCATSNLKWAHILAQGCIL